MNAVNRVGRMKTYLKSGVFCVGLFLVAGCRNASSTANFKVHVEGESASREDIKHVAGLLESPEFKERLRDRMRLPRSGEVGGSVDIRSLKVTHRKGGAELGLVIDAIVEQPPAAAGRKWVIFKGGRSGASKTDYRLVFPYDECYRIVPEVLDEMQGESAYRVVEGKLRGLDRLLQELVEELRKTQEPLDYLRQEYGIFPPDNQSEAMRQVRLLEQKRMELSVQIRAIREANISPADEQELARLYPLLHAAEEELHSASEIAKAQLGMLGEIEHLQQRIESLTGQIEVVEIEMNELRRSLSNPPRIRIMAIRAN